MRVSNTSVTPPLYLASKGDVSCLQPELGQYSSPALFLLQLLSLPLSFIPHGSVHYALCVVATERSPFVRSFFHTVALPLTIVAAGKQD